MIGGRSNRNRWRLVLAAKPRSGLLLVASLLAGLAATAAGQPAPQPIDLTTTPADTRTTEIAPSDTLTIEQAVAFAVANDRRVIDGTLQVQRAQQSLAAARSRRLPDLDLQVQASALLAPVGMTFPAGAFGSFDPIGPVPATNTRVESATEPVVTVVGKLVQPLTGLHRIGLGVKAAELTGELEQERLRAQRVTITNEVRRLYYGILATERALTASQQQLEVDRELGRIVAVQVSREVVLQEAALDIEARRVAQEYTILQLRGELASRKENLNVLLGRHVDAALHLTDVPETLPTGLDWETAQQRALQNRPDLAQARLQMDLADTDRRSKKAELLPDLSFALSYQTFYNADLLPRNIAQVGLLFEWQPFDWGDKRRQLDERTSAHAQAENAALAARDRALIEVRDRYRKVEEAAKLLEARKLALDAAREKARVAMNRRAEESSLLADALQAEATAADANAQYQQAVLSLWTARADLEEVIGETL